MRRLCCSLLALALALVVPAPAQRTTNNFDGGWLFLQSDAPGAQAPAFDDKSWKSVTLPHDWAIAGPFVADAPTGGAGAFAPSGVSWYRNHFPSFNRPGNHVEVDFDGIMANSDVYLNGHLLGHRPSGYVPIHYDLTPYLNPGANADNVLAVRTDTSQQPASRFYTGAGIYRHVRLVSTEPVHFVTDTIFITTPKVSAASATIHVSATVQNDSDSPATPTVVSGFDPDIPHAGVKVAFSLAMSPSIIIAPHSSAVLEAEFTTLKPELWNIDHPTLYNVIVSLNSTRQANAHQIDSAYIPIGIREFHFDPNLGFMLNGRPHKLLGVAIHEDIAAFGMAVPTGAYEHRLAALRTMGTNAIRTAHNAVTPEFLSACDRMGFLVMDEFFDMWTVAKNPFDYHLYFREWYLKDAHDTILRDRNHPSIILWSAGNEIHDTPNPALAKPILAALVAQYHKDDPTRPVTQALFRPNVSHDYEDGLADMLDVIGQNYRPLEILAAHAQKPSRSIVGTENIHDRDSWLQVRDHKEYSGMFLWSGVDYLGESRRFPLLVSNSGMLDRTDAPKPDALERQAWWSSRPVVHIVRRVAVTAAAPTDPGYAPLPGATPAAPTAGPRPAAPENPTHLPQGPRSAPLLNDWTPVNLAPHEENVEVFSNCANVELFLNGKSLGIQPLPPDASPMRWKVNFVPGTIQAICRATSKSAKDLPPAQPVLLPTSGVPYETLRTAGAPARITLTVEAPAKAHLSNSFDSVAYVRATVLDQDGTPVPDAGNQLHFTLTGPGAITALDNADNTSAPTSLGLPGAAQGDRKAFRGNAIAIVRAFSSSGVLHLSVSSAGLAPATAAIPIAN